VDIMTQDFDHQKTLGVIGVSSDAHAFILKAKKLGYVVNLLTQSTKEVKLDHQADHVFVGTLDDEALREEFLMKSDLLVYYDETISPTQLDDIQKTVITPQGEPLLSLAQDLILQSAFLESLSVNIAPYVTVVKPEDIRNGLKSIGYPARLRTNQMNPENNNQMVFIYDEDDIEKAASLLKYGTCVLESWIFSEQELSVTIVKSANGEIIHYPIVEKEYRDDRLFYIKAPATVDEDIAVEIKRVTNLIFENIDFRGVATIDFLISPAQALYIGDIYPYPNILSRYTEKYTTLSATEAHLRAINTLPIPGNMRTTTSYLFVPFYYDQKDIIDRQITVKPDWDFTFYPIAEMEKHDNQEAVGHIIIETNNPKKILTTFKQ